MRKFTTEEIAKATNGKTTGHADITSIVIDDREVIENSLFIAIKGERLDGHSFVKSAVKAGAVAVMVHKDIEDCKVPVIRVEDTTKAFLDIACYYRNSFDIPLVALTGSVGKTTTKEMIWCVLNAKYNTHKTKGNLNNEIGLPKVLLSMEETHTAAVIEMGMNHKGEISTLSKTALPNMAVITNIGVSHIENLGSREEILSAKLEILDGLKTGSTVFLNADDDMLNMVISGKVEKIECNNGQTKNQKLDGLQFDNGLQFNNGLQFDKSKLNNFKIKTFGIKNEADVTATDIEYLDESTKFIVNVNAKEKFEVEIPTTGEHNVLNALAAISVGLRLDIDTKDITKALLNYSPAEMRESIEKIGDITLIKDCYNASPDSVKALSNTLKIKGRDGQRKIAVIADMLELGEYSEKAHRDAGVYIAQAKVDILFTYGKLSKFTADSARKNGVEQVFEFNDKEKLADELLKVLHPGDVVAFKGSRGMKLEDVIDVVIRGIE
ncbi:MAG: UDP-N-acetylmuramoyl-tripeptide--D-alanyl-D-alanine ligase [Ruminococcaceae bacterium]|nr:UDP-N-acetylmuramoyl-tripeptide--D-alanyl-D-alanine ligase [Oscillospiraceae bacterium]